MDAESVLMASPSDGEIAPMPSNLEPVIPQRAYRRALFFPSINLIKPGFWTFAYFHPAEIACRHCGGILLDYNAMSCLDRFRHLIRQPITVTSGYRCIVHNRNVGSQDSSFHPQGRAFDLICPPDQQQWWQQIATRAGFSGFGFYDTFIHVDDGPRRVWNQK